MFMVTKTITITEHAYKLLLDAKLEGESFSQEITRIMTNGRKRSWREFVGVLSDETAEKMKSDLKKIKEKNLEMLKERLKNESSGL